LNPFLWFNQLSIFSIILDGLFPPGYNPLNILLNPFKPSLKLKKIVLKCIQDYVSARLVFASFKKNYWVTAPPKYPLSLVSGNVNTRWMVQPDMGSIFYIKKSMKYSGHRKLLCELSKLSI